MFESCAIIGRKQHEKALELYHGPTALLEDTVDYVHTYVKMPGLNVTDSATGAPLGTLCKAAMGDSFAAGTTDGPGMFDFTQGSNTTNPFWNILVDFLHKATPEERACQHPKGILLPTGSLNTPWPWAPSTLPFSLLRLGGFAIIVVPSELTTMAGRRLRNAVRERMIAKGLMGGEGHVVIAGLSNAYADYTTTFEEYQAQRYEAGSTIFGPHQLQAYIQTMLGLVDSMAAGTTPAKDPPPEDFSHKCVNEFQKGKLHTDYLPRGAKHFGDVLREPQASYKPGEVAVVSFAGANPTNNLRPQGTFLEVQVQSGSDWVTVADDGDWETRISIEKTRVDLVEHARTWHMSWYIPADAVPGTYRIQHFGTSYDDPLIGKATKTEYTGTSATFTVAAA